MTEEQLLTAESPFLEGTKIQFAWDATSLSALKKCPRYYEYTIVEGWRKKDESVHLTFGSIYASAIELYEKSRAGGFDYAAAVDAAIEHALCASVDFRTDHKFKNRETLIRSLVWYFEAYHDQEHICKTLTLADGRAAVELSFKFNAGFDIYDESGAPHEVILCGHLDRVVDYAGTPYVMDQKTTGSTLSGYYFSQYDPHNQMTLYTLASRIVFGFPVAGVIIDAAQIAVGFTAFSRGITMRSEAQLEEWLGATRKWIDVARNYALEEHWPMNEESCSNYGGCTFKSICSQDPRVRQKFLETDFERRVWNPLIPR